MVWGSSPLGRTSSATTARLLSISGTIIHMDKDYKYLDIEKDNGSEDLFETDDGHEKKQSRLSRFFLGLFDLVKTVVLIVILTYGIRLFIIQPFIVEGQSMEPSFQNGDYLITEKISFRIRPPERGEIVIFHPPDNPDVNYIKRLVGLPGDVISISDGAVHVNGKKILEPYLSSDNQTVSTQKEGSAITLKEGEYFVMGDNRNHSRDSREIGPIPTDSIVSRIWFRLLPIQQARAFAAVKYQTAP